jgi:tetratricopeptide (TPR) repeat protein
VAPPFEPAAHYIEHGDRLAAEKELDEALSEYRKALAVLTLAQKRERAEIYVRMANIRWQQGKRREAIASFEKALQITPEHRPALSALIDLNIGESDWRGVHAAEERFLASVELEDERFEHLVRFAERWHGAVGDEARALASYERARAIRPDDLKVLAALRKLYESANAIEDAIEARRRIAEVTQDPRAKASEYFELGQYLLEDLKDEERGLRMLDLALESDPTLLEPLALIAQVLADRQEWGQLELAYRRMLGRVGRSAEREGGGARRSRIAQSPRAALRRDVRWELNRRLGLLFRDHLEDPASALGAFEDALQEKPDDLPTLLTAAAIARTAGRLDRAAAHLQAAAALDPADEGLFHELFELFQKLRRPDEAWAAAGVIMDLGVADARERIIYEEHRPDGVPRFTRALREASWERLRAADRDANVEAVLAAVAESAIDASIARRTSEGKLAQLDPRARQDPQQSTVSVVRSFAWASHLLGVEAPAIYLGDDDALGLAAVVADHPAVIAGGAVLRGRSLPELAFLVGSHLAYHVGPHRLLLYYPSIDDLRACFLAAVSLVRPSIPIPASLEEAARDLAPDLDARLYGGARDRLFAAVEAFEEAGARADLAHWAGAVDRCASRAGYLLCGDLPTAAELVRSESSGAQAPEEKVGDLYGFAVSDAAHALRVELGIAIEP